MHTETRVKALREACHHLAKAIQALQDAGYSRLGLDAYDVLNNVLRARQDTERRAAVTVVPDAELRTRSLTVEVR